MASIQIQTEEGLADAQGVKVLTDDGWMDADILILTERGWLSVLNRG